MSPVNDFDECLAASHAAHDLPLWREVYQHAFPNMVGMHCLRHDGDHQRAGVDRSVTLWTGKAVLIDEKVRGRNKLTGQVYQDIALEYVSNDRRQTPGWVCKPLMCDYIAYAIAPLGVAYLLPVHALQAAWSRNCKRWLETKRKIAARNRGYQTLSVCVEANEVMKAVGGVLRPKFTPVDLDE